MAKKKQGGTTELKHWIKKFWVLYFSVLGFLFLFFTAMSFGLLGFMPSFEELENPKSFVASQIITPDKKRVNQKI